MTDSVNAPDVPHPRHLLDALMNSPVRLSIVACVAASDRVEFAFVRDTVQVSDSVLSKQVSALEAAGYVEVSKGYVGKRPRTWLVLSTDGRRAFNQHIAALSAIAALPAGTFTPDELTRPTARKV
jgi:DNA-binding MarR family transcriptional regulator